MDNDKMFDKKEIEETVKCNDCGWDGFLAEIEEDYYASPGIGNPMPHCCPMCGGENLE